MKPSLPTIQSSPFGALVIGVAGALGLTGCGAATFAPVPTPPDPRAGEAVDAVLYLVGDAGDPDSGSPILSNETAACRRISGSRCVLYAITASTRDWERRML